jgi:hypothetical protein
MNIFKICEIIFFGFAVIFVIACILAAWLFVGGSIVYVLYMLSTDVCHNTLLGGVAIFVFVTVYLSGTVLVFKAVGEP